MHLTTRARFPAARRPAARFSAVLVALTALLPLTARAEVDPAAPVPPNDRAEVDPAEPAPPNLLAETAPAPAAPAPAALDPADPAATRRAQTRRARTNREQRARDHIGLEAGTYLGAITGGDFDFGPTAGVRATLGLRLSPDIALEASALAAADLMVQGYTSTGWTLGMAWFPADSLRIGAGLRSRRFTDSLGLFEAIGGALAHAFAAGLCDERDRDCAEFDYDALAVWDMGAEVSLASQWQWSVFTLAVEWVSLYQPLALFDADRVFYRNDGSRLGALPVDLRVRDLPRELRFVGVSVGVSL